MLHDPARWPAQCVALEEVAKCESLEALAAVFVRTSHGGAIRDPHDVLKGLLQLAGCQLAPMFLMQVLLGACSSLLFTHGLLAGDLLHSAVPNQLPGCQLAIAHRNMYWVNNDSFKRPVAWTPACWHPAKKESFTHVRWNYGLLFP